MRTAKPGLTFSAAGHSYHLDGRPVPGVTTILGVLNKPALVYWSAKMVAEHVVDNLELVEQLRAWGRGPLVDALKATPWEKRDKAAAKGTAFHKLAEDIAWEGKEVDVPEPLVPLVEHAVDFLETWRIEPVLTEAPVASRSHWYAGTLDLLADYVHPITGEKGRAVWDWKSGKAIYPEAAFQLQAYASAEFAWLGGKEVPVPEVTKSFGVHVRSDGVDVIPLEFGPAVFDEFCVIRQAFDIKRRADGSKKVRGYVGSAIEFD